MKLKDILREGSKRKWIRVLKEKLETGKWRVEDPEILRGRKKQDKPVKEKYTTSGRDPQDTDEIVDGLVNVFHDICYPKFPARNESRFGTTDYSYAYGFATNTPGEEGRVYVILPAKSATIYYRPSDPIQVFSDISNSLSILPHLMIEWWEDDNGREKWSEYPEYYMYLADSLKEMVSNKRVEKQFIQELGCPPRLLELVQESMDEVSRVEDGRKPKWVSNVNKSVSRINDYFDELELGWPEESNDEDEVTFHGDYLQVEKGIYEEVKRMYK